MKVRISKAARDEMWYKLDVMSDGIDEAGSIAESYGLTQTSFDALYAKVARFSATSFDLTSQEIAVCIGELQDSADIAASNMSEDGDTFEYRKAYRMCVRAIATLKGVRDNAICDDFQALIVSLIILPALAREDEATSPAVRS